MTADELEFGSIRYTSVVRVVPLRSGRLGVIDSRHRPLGIVESLADATALTAITMIAEAFRRRRVPVAKPTGLKLNVTL